MATRKKPYDPSKRYALTLAEVVQIDGFAIRPGPNADELPVVTGDFANRIAAEQPGAIAAARELPPERDITTTSAPEMIHETAEGERIVGTAPAH